MGYNDEVIRAAFDDCSAVMCRAWVQRGLDRMLQRTWAENSNRFFWAQEVKFNSSASALVHVVFFWELERLQAINDRLPTGPPLLFHPQIWAVIVCCTFWKVSQQSKWRVAFCSFCGVFTERLEKPFTTLLVKWISDTQGFDVSLVWMF